MKVSFTIVLTIARSALERATNHLESLRPEDASLSEIGTAGRSVREAAAALDIALRGEPHIQEVKKAEEDRLAAYEAKVKSDIRTRYLVAHPGCPDDTFEELYEVIRAEYAEADSKVAKSRARSSYPQTI